MAYKIGVIGLGNMGRNHLKACSLHPDFSLVVGCSRSQERREAAEEQFSVATVADYRDVAGQVDAVVVATPTQSHAEIASFFIEAGVHVLLEKPIALAVAEAQLLQDLALAKGVVLQIGHVEQYNPGWVAGVQWWAEQGLGLPQLLTAHRLGPWVDRPRDTGVTLDLMIHDVELVLSLYERLSPAGDGAGERGTPVQVKAAQTLLLHSEYDDLAMATLELSPRDGAAGTARLVASRISDARARVMRLHHDDVVLEIDFLNRSARSIVGDAVTKIPVREQDQLSAQLTRFSAAIAGSDGLVGVRSATDALATCLDVLRVDRELCER